MLSIINFIMDEIFQYLFSIFMKNLYKNFPNTISLVNDIYRFGTESKLFFYAYNIFLKQYHLPYLFHMIEENIKEIYIYIYIYIYNDRYLNNIQAC